MHEGIINARENDDPKVRRNFKKESNRGRKETREVIHQPIPKDLAAFAKWAGIKPIGVIHRTRETSHADAKPIWILPITVLEADSKIAE